MMKEMNVVELMKVDGGAPIIEKFIEKVGPAVEGWFVGVVCQAVLDQAVKPLPHVESKQPGFNRP